MPIASSLKEDFCNEKAHNLSQTLKVSSEPLSHSLKVPIIIIWFKVVLIKMLFLKIVIWGKGEKDVHQEVKSDTNRKRSSGKKK